LITTPGLSETAARVLLVARIETETGFPPLGTWVSRARLCPHGDTSAGTRHSTRIRHFHLVADDPVDPRRLGCRLEDCTCTLYSSRSSGKCRGPKKAIAAVAAAMLTAA
jgi:hypothetical protein